MNKKFSILVTEPLAEDAVLLLKNHGGFQVDVCLNLAKGDLLQKIGSYHALLVRSQTSVDKAVLEAGTQLMLVGRAGVGIDNIDIKTAKARCISVVNTPRGNTISAAELAFGLMLGLARKIPQAHEHVREEKWQRNSFMGVELYKKTIGIIGFGNIGQELAKRSISFAMHVLAYDPYLEDDVFSSHQVEKASLDRVFAESDFLSLHCGLTEVTKNLVNEFSLSTMKKGAFLINTARGELIDDQALLNALNAERLSGVALDVYRTEPPLSKDPLVNHQRVITTPHLGASTKEAQQRVATTLAEETIKFFATKLALNPLVR